MTVSKYLSFKPLHFMTICYIYFIETLTIFLSACSLLSRTKQNNLFLSLYSILLIRLLLLFIS